MKSSASRHGRRRPASTADNSTQRVHPVYATRASLAHVHVQGVGTGQSTVGDSKLCHHSDRPFVSAKLAPG